MSEPIHVIVTLSPETIAALRGEQTYQRRPLYGRKPEPVPEVEVVREALEGRLEVTIRELAAALGIPEEKRDRSMAVRLGAAIDACGWHLAGQRGAAPRERFYRPTVPAAVLR